MPDLEDVVTLDFPGATGRRYRPAVVVSSALYHAHRQTSSSDYSPRILLRLARRSTASSTTGRQPGCSSPRCRARMRLPRPASISSCRRCTLHPSGIAAS